MKNILAKFFTGASPDFTFLEVLCNKSAASLLNLMIIMHADGKCDDPFEENQREIHTALIRICNQNILSIPFNQLTINMAEHPPIPE